jgi:hypothetical protein
MVLMVEIVVDILVCIPNLYSCYPFIPLFIPSDT